jgi:HSP20 family protein
MARTALPSLFSDFGAFPALGGMRREFEEMLNRAGASGALMPMPAMDVLRDDEAVTVTFDLPGVRAAELDVSLQGDVLTVAGERSVKREEKNGDAVHCERHHGSFSRSIRLGFEPAEDAVRSDLSDGVLTIRIKRPPEAKAGKRKIEVAKG